MIDRATVITILGKLTVVGVHNSKSLFHEFVKFSTVVVNWSVYTISSV